MGKWGKGMGAANGGAGGSVGSPPRRLGILDYLFASATLRSCSVQGMQQQTALAIRSVIPASVKRRLKRNSRSAIAHRILLCCSQTVSKFAKVEAELERGDPNLGLPDQVKGKKPRVRRQFGRLHGRAGRESGLMAAGSASITPEAAAIDQPMLMAIAAGTAEAIGSAPSPRKPLLRISPRLNILLGA